ncbi:hypothetical protein FN976_18055 [Caenimonas sedimenti]|uniref:Uncharacterized protein n=1 Tax=Caenimonas sedimenti TaxID=2596921 RepID=A0A562ZN34_9BURK|nr:hypothetical protein [Caenimonas sedimenti]TWO69728.1 hypothetical protein FN976_18055 [Caenimonas sedimenti]
MQRKIATVMLAASLLTPVAHAHPGDLSAVSALSMLPVASVVVGGSMVAGAALALPVALSVTGAVLVVKTVEVGVRSSLYVLERASDGARVSVEVVHNGTHHASLAVGSNVAVSVIGAGVVLSAAGEAIAFVPNALGRALLHNERLTN